MSGVREETRREEEPAQTDDADIEARARRNGWVPLEEYRGDKSRFVTAEAFVQGIDDNLPRQKERNRVLDSKLRRMEQQLGMTQEALNDLRGMAAKNEQRAYDRARADLVAQQQQAVQTADTATYSQVTAELQRLETDKPKPAPEPVKPPPPEDFHELQQWIGTKGWWNKDQALTQLVTNMHAHVIAKNPGIGQMEALRKVERMLADEYPQELGRPRSARSQAEDEELEEVTDETTSRRNRRETPAAVGGAQLTGAAAPRRSGKPVKITDLPRDEQADARRAFEKYKGLMAGSKNPFTEEEYVRNYLDQ